MQPILDPDQIDNVDEAGFPAINRGDNLRQILPIGPSMAVADRGGGFADWQAANSFALCCMAK